MFQAKQGRNMYLDSRHKDQKAVVKGRSVATQSDTYQVSTQI